MKVSCEIIKDILPLYHDGVCSPESTAMVDEHLSCCNECREELTAMGKELTIDSKIQNLSEAAAVNNLSKRWKKGMRKSLLKGAMIALLVLLGLYLVFSIFFGIGVYVS